MMGALFLKAIALMQVSRFLCGAPGKIKDDYIYGIVVPAVKVSVALIAACFLAYSIRQTLLTSENLGE